MIPLITFTSDFGQKDIYVSSVKAVILSRLPQAVLLDVTHEIPPFKPILALPPLVEIMELCPPCSIHLVVVDPGVGSSRRALVAMDDERFIVFPDNGLPHLLSRWIPELRFFHLNDPRLFGGKETPTFQGRDFFAPAVVALAKGIRPSDLGPEVPLDTLVQDPLFGCPPGDLLVWNVDRFGNVLLGYRALRNPDSVAIKLGKVTIPFVKRYQDVPGGHLGSLINSSGWLEIFCREAHASDRTGLLTGMSVTATITGGQGVSLNKNNHP